MRELGVRGVDLDYDITGDGPMLVWGHGLSGSRAHDDALGLLNFGHLQRSCRVLRYDARGHGTSAMTGDPHDYSWTSLAADQLALADRLTIESYIAGGASMGCGTALHAAVQASERVEGLLLVIPPSGWETRQAQAAVWSQLAAGVEANGVDAFINGVLELESPDPFLGRSEWEESLNVQRQMSPEQLATLLRGAATADLPDRDAIRSLSQPALVLAWTGDPGHPATTAEELAELLPNSELCLASTWDELQSWTDRATTFLTSL
ncbi:MAG: alpha/beta fold hydrolase [Actinomycetia bacterium]|nr:alpha/beta fold hydrolase [Actinomycetes bacterium]